MAVQVRTHLVDTDVHEMLSSPLQLLPHLASKWHHLITDYGWNTFNATNAGFPYTNPSPGRGARLDAYPDEGVPGSSLEWMQRQLLDLFHVDIAILCGFFHPQSMQIWPEFAVDAARAYNDWQIENWLDKDPRLRGSVHFATHDPALAAREIDRLGGHPQVVQAFLPVVNDKQWGEQRYFPIYEAAARNGLAIAMHHNGQTRTSLGFPPYYVEHHVTLCQAHMSQVASLIFGGVFDRFPELKIVVMEAGFSWLPHLVWRIDQHLKQFRSEVPWVKRRAVDYVRDNIRLTTQPMEPIPAKSILDIFEMVGCDDFLLFSSDYPHYDFDSPDAVLPAGLPPAVVEKVRWRNAAATFGFDFAA